MSWFSSLFAWFSSIFFTKSAEIAIVGLQGSGKTSFVNVLEIGGGWTEDVVPTVAFSYRMVRRDNIKFKIWDVAGQPRYRNLWERYCKGSDAVVFVVDSHDREHFGDVKFELHNLLGEKGLVGTPLLVLGNKNDLPGHASAEEIISELSLDTITNRPVSVSIFPMTASILGHLTLTLLDPVLLPVSYSQCYSCSMRSQHNLDVVVKWLAKRAS